MYAEQSYYHVYNRGVNKRLIFRDDEDYAVFMSLLKRYLDPQNISKEKYYRPFISYSDDLKLRAFCLMPNHFHLLIFQYSPDAMQKFMKSLMTAYTMYFNKKYKRVGHLFQDRYKASIIQTDSYLLHISRYIHLNPENYRAWPYSSLQYYLGDKSSTWVDHQPVLELFEGSSYIGFIQDYEGHRQMLKEIKHSLADV